MPHLRIAGKMEPLAPGQGAKRLGNIGHNTAPSQQDKPVRQRSILVQASQGCLDIGQPRLHRGRQHLLDLGRASPVNPPPP